MELKLQGQEDYPNILKYLVDGGIDYITEVNMSQIEIFCKNFFYYLVRRNDTRTDFPDLAEIMVRYRLDTKEQAIKKARRLELDRIIVEVLEMYKILKVSYKRQGRIEIVNEAKKKMDEMQYMQDAQAPMKKGEE